MIFLIIFSIILILIISNFTYCKEQFYNIFKKEKIVFSLTCHESPDCVIDLIENIYKCFELFDIYILISTTNKINEELQTKINKYKNIKIVSIRDYNINIWGNIALFNQHILNMKYLFDNNINYDYFWFIVSNELFIKKMNPNNLKNIIIDCTIKNNFSIKEIDTYYNDFLAKKTYDWSWYQFIKEDTYLIDTFKKEKIKIFPNTHEGLVLSKKLTDEIYNKYTELLINENSTNKNYPMEEVFISSYLQSKYKCNKFNSLHRNINWSPINDNKDFKEILETVTNDSNIYSIKPITRDINDPFRIYIKNYIK